MVGVIAAFAVSLLWATVAPTGRFGSLITDDPSGDDLKVHRRSVPPIGGVGVWIGIHAGLALNGGFDSVFLLASLVVVTLGLVDDARGVPPWTRLVVEVAAGTILLGSGDPGLGIARSLVIVAGVVVAVNAFNLFDGLDGLAGSVAFVSTLGVGLAFDRPGAWVLAAAILGFLIRNWHPATVFLGDNGSYLLGLSLIYLGAEGSRSALEPLLALAMTGVVLIDLGVTVIRRRSGGHPLFVGDRSHVYDQLVDRGHGVPAVVLRAALAQALVVGLVVGALRLGGMITGLATAIAVGAVGLGAAWVGGFVRPS